MATLDQSNITTHLAPQTIEGVIDTNPVFVRVRRTGGTMSSKPTYVTGNELQVDGQAPKQVKDKEEKELTIEFDMSQETAGYFDAVIHGAQVDNSKTASTAIEATATGYIMPAGHVSDLSVGDWYGIEGSAASENDKIYKVSVIVSATEITTSEAPPTVESAGASITLSSRKTASGVTKTLFTAQRRVLDKSKVGDIAHSTFRDVRSNSGSISFGQSGIVTGSFDYKMGAKTEGSAVIAGQTDGTVDISDSISAAERTAFLYVDGVGTGCLLSSMDVEFNSNYEGDGGGYGGCAEEFGRGQTSVSGAIKAKTDDQAATLWEDRNQNGTRIALASSARWPDGRWMITEVTRAIVTEHTYSGDTVVSNDMSYTAEGDPITGATVQIFRNF